MTEIIYNFAENFFSTSEYVRHYELANKCVFEEYRDDINAIGIKNINESNYYKTVLKTVPAQLAEFDIYMLKGFKEHNKNSNINVSEWTEDEMLELFANYYARNWAYCYKKAFPMQMEQFGLEFGRNSMLANYARIANIAIRDNDF